ncbi:hypothetical protein OG896_01270 [Streptomyces sp. NBC_00669]|uniref:hypothetical protein n=1 Tax=unclassified Streptomyces TaxID=2593676 RepID=UPI002E371E46|nr:hypothetical protein [Streptomyces sp. NBC_00669]
MRIRKNAVTLLAATALLTGLGAVVGTTSASAASPCDSYGYTNNSSGYGHMLGTYHLKSEPAAACSNTGTATNGSGFYMWCYVYNYYGNVWVYGRVQGTETKGWMSGDNVTWESGSLNYC